MEPEQQQLQITIGDLDSKEFVDTNLSKTIKKADTDGDVTLYCYTTATRDSPDYIKSARGLVYDGNDLVYTSFAFSDEYVVGEDDEQVWNRLEQFDPDECMIFDSYEGFLIRVFYLQDRWYISTHRRLNAYKSHWSSRVSCGKIFENAIEHSYENLQEFRERIETVSTGNDESTILERYLETLDKDYCYAFLTRNTDENRIVCDAPIDSEQKVYFVGRFEKNDRNVRLDVDVGVPKPPKVLKRAELMDYAMNVDIHKQQGVIVFLPDGSQFKILHPDYRYLYDVRGNESSIKFRYLQVRMDNEKREALISLYPSAHEIIDKYENTIYCIAKHLKNLYIQRYIHRELSTLPPQEFKIVNLCHKWHREDREKHRISIEKVIDILNEQTPTFLNRMIREFLQEEDLKKRIHDLNKDTIAVVSTS